MSLMVDGLLTVNEREDDPKELTFLSVASGNKTKLFVFEETCVFVFLQKENFPPVRILFKLWCFPPFFLAEKQSCSINLWLVGDADG